MSDNQHCRIRIRLTSGTELETEGPEAFVREEAGRLLLTITGQPEAASPEPLIKEAQPHGTWKQVAEIQKNDLILKALPLENQTENACIMLLGAAQVLLGVSRPTATQIAKWLRKSSCSIKRLDRALNSAVQRSEILAAGYKRSRRYELTSSGLRKANLLALQLASRQQGI
jgi:hypothetical protein